MRTGYRKPGALTDEFARRDLVLGIANREIGRDGDPGNSIGKPRQSFHQSVKLKGTRFAVDVMPASAEDNGIKPQRISTASLASA